MKNIVITIILTALGFNSLYGADTYTNPIIDMNVPDPTVLRDDDGFFYMTATENITNMPLFRSADLVNWTLAGTVFKEGDKRLPRYGLRNFAA